MFVNLEVEFFFEMMIGWEETNIAYIDVSWIMCL